LLTDGHSADSGSNASGWALPWLSAALFQPFVELVRAPNSGRLRGGLVGEAGSTDNSKNFSVQSRRRSLPFFMLHRVLDHDRDRFAFFSVIVTRDGPYAISVSTDGNTRRRSVRLLP